MKKDTKTKKDTINFVKSVIGSDTYKKLLLDISGELSKNKIDDVSTEETIQIADLYCFIILSIAYSKKIDTTTYSINLNNGTMKIKASEFAQKYKEYIKIVEDARFKQMKKTL